MVATSSKLYGKITLKGIRMLSEHLSNYTLVGARKVQIIKKMQLLRLGDFMKYHKGYNSYAERKIRFKIRFTKLQIIEDII